MSGSRITLIVFSAIPGLAIFALILLRAFGLLCPYSIPTGGMRPAVAPGDHFMMEGISYLSREPRRGDIVVFKTDGITSLQPSQLYIKRVAGEPGEHVRLLEGKLFINEKQASLSNGVGKISYYIPPFGGRFETHTDVQVPQGQYYLLGDNSTNSSDSRYWGTVPRGNIIGRVWFSYWPPQRVGGIK
jgi:signal peptidase I